MGPGVNHDLPDPAAASDDWSDDVEEIARSVGKLASTSGREFVIGINDADTGSSEDLHSILGTEVDLLRLRAMIGAELPTPRRRSV